MKRLLFSAFCFSSLALAQDATQQAAPKVKVERSASGQKIFRITEGSWSRARSRSPTPSMFSNAPAWITIGSR